jgi:hypothetical protein
MRRLVRGALALVIILAAGASGRADAAFSDQLCPEATQYVVALGTVKPTDAQAVYAAVHAVAAAYDTCSKRALADGNVEPGVHYAYTREASYEIVEARALVAMNRPGDAKALTQNAKRLAQDVIDWRRSYEQSGSGNSITSSGSDTRPSTYRDSAKDIVAAANDLLAKIAAMPAPATSAVPAPSPHR